jgi:hypothetical protein
MLGPMAEPQQPAVIGEQVFRMKARQLPSEDEAKAISKTPRPRPRSPASTVKALRS